MNTPLQSSSPAPLLTRRHHATQRGDALFDAMIATLLVMVLGMGPMYVATRAAVAQREGVIQQVAASELRSILLSTPKSEICTASGPVGLWATPQIFQVQSQVSGGPAVDMTVTTLCQNTDVEIAGVTVTQPMATLVGCLPAATGVSGPLIMREGGVLEDEPTSCEEPS